jgi:glycosyltransferase involved in cell wall biosynthesis
MKIVIVSRAENVSGKEIMTLELGEGLRNAGHSTQYITSFWNDRTYPKRLAQLGFDPILVDLGSISATLRWDCIQMTLKQVVRLPVLWADYRRFLRTSKPDNVIHTSWHHLLVLSPLLSPARDWYWVHEVIPDKAHYHRVFKWLSRRLRGFIAVSNAVRESLRKAGIPCDKVHVIHNGLRDLASGGPSSGNHGGECRIGIVGQVEEWKGHHDLLDAFARISARHPGASLHIYGAGSEAYSNRLKRQIQSLGITDRVIWHGFVVERTRIYRELDVCVVPVPIGATEALPTIAIEAAFFGLPMVGSRCGGLVEIIEDGKTGFLVESGNIDELSARLEQLLGDPLLRNQMGIAARKTALARFGQGRFVSEFVQLLTKSSVLAGE